MCGAHALLIHCTCASDPRYIPSTGPAPGRAQGIKEDAASVLEGGECVESMHCGAIAPIPIGHGWIKSENGFEPILSSGALRLKGYVSNTAEGRKNVIRPRFVTFLPDLTNSIQHSIANSRFTTHAIAPLIFHVQYGHPSNRNSFIAFRFFFF